MIWLQKVLPELELLGEVVPGLVVSTQGGRFFPRLRGIGNSLISAGYESGIATYVDGVYYAATPSAILTFNNIERVEVLKGPQGTLFGRNATGGLIQVVSKKPQSEAGGDIKLSYGNYDTGTIVAYFTGGLSDTVAADLAIHYAEQGDGWGTNLNSGKDVYRVDEDAAFRASILFTPSDATEVRLAVDYMNREGSFSANKPYIGFLYDLAGNDANTGAPLAPNGIDDLTEGLIDDTSAKNHDVSLSSTPFTSTEGLGASLHITHQFDFATLTSITAYRENANLFQQEGDTTRIEGVELFINQYDEQFSQELQLSDTTDSGASWVVGAYWFDADSNFDPFGQTFSPSVIPPPFGSRTLDSNLTTESYAFYGQTTFPVMDSTNLTLGVRYTSEDREIEADDKFYLLDFLPVVGGSLAVQVPSKQEISASKTTYRLALDHHFSDDVMGFISYNTGFKSGGFNGSTPTAEPFDPEEIASFEVGLKAELADGQVRLNTAAFYYEYEDIQIARFIPGATVFYNIPEAEVLGLDFEFEAVVSERLHLTGGFTVLDTEIGSHDWQPGPNGEAPSEPVVFHEQIPTGGNRLYFGNAEGNQLPNAPELSVSLGAEYTVPLSDGELIFNGQYSYNDGYYWNTDNSYDEPSYSLFSGSVIWAMSSGLELSLWGRNLADKFYRQTVTYSNGSTASIVAPPRTYGASIRYSF